MSFNVLSIPEPPECSGGGCPSGPSGACRAVGMGCYLKWDQLGIEILAQSYLLCIAIFGRTRIQNTRFFKSPQNSLTFLAPTIVDLAQARSARVAI